MTLQEYPKSVEEIFDDYQKRRGALLRALTDGAPRGGGAAPSCTAAAVGSQLHASGGGGCPQCCPHGSRHPAIARLQSWRTFTTWQIQRGTTCACMVGDAAACSSACAGAAADWPGWSGKRGSPSPALGLLLHGVMRAGGRDGNWSVDLPADEVPPELPEPCLGINFARDGMQRVSWRGVPSHAAPCAQALRACPNRPVCPCDRARPPAARLGVAGGGSLGLLAHGGGVLLRGQAGCGGEVGGCWGWVGGGDWHACMG